MAIVVPAHLIIWSMGDNFKAILYSLAVGDGRLRQVQQTGIIIDFDVMVVIFTDIADPVVRLRTRMPAMTIYYQEDEEEGDDEIASEWSIVSMGRWRRSGRHRSFVGRERRQTRIRAVLGCLSRIADSECKPPAVDDWSEYLVASAPVRAYAHVR